MVDNKNNITHIVVGGADDGQRLDRFLKRERPDLAYHLVQKLVRKGFIRVNRKKVKPDFRLEANTTIEIRNFEDRSNHINSSQDYGDSDGTVNQAHEVAQRRRIDEWLDKIEILEDTKKRVLINKPTGLATQGGSGVTISVDDLLPAMGEGYKLCHRLDKDTSGVLLIAKNREAASRYMQGFKSREIQKTYLAIVKGNPQNQGMINAPLGQQLVIDGSNEKMTIDEEDGQYAQTYFEVLDRAGKEASLVALFPKTGRKHQLRVHMAAVDHPILGDGKYGGKDAFVDGVATTKMHLHAYAMQHPKLYGEPLEVVASLPPHMVKTLKFLGLEVPKVINLPESL